MLNEIVILKRKIAAKGKRSETRRKANKDMKRENESVYLSAEGSTSKKIMVHLHITRLFLMKWTGLFFEYPLYTQLKFIPPARKAFVAWEYFTEISVSDNRAYNNINEKISDKARTQSLSWNVSFFVKGTDN